VKDLPQRKFDSAKKAWHVPVSRVADDPEIITDILDIASEYNLEITEAAQKLLVISEPQPEIEPDFSVHGFDKVLKDYQREGVRHILNAPNGRSYLGDTMGLGKTLQAIASACITDQFPVLVVCPNSLKYGWANEIKQWTGITDADICIADGGKHKFKANAKWYIMNYDVLEKLKLPIINVIKPKFIIGDEAHLVKNNKAKRTKALREICEEVNPSHRLLMSGTIFTNRPNEVISQLQILGIFNKFADTVTQFQVQFCDAFKQHIGRGRYIWNTNGASNTHILRSKLNKFGYLRREKEEVLTELPPKIRSEVYVDITNSSVYNRAAADYLEFLKATKDNPYDVSEEAIHLQQIEGLKQLAWQGKRKAVLEWVENFFQQEDKLVLFVNHKEAVRDMKEAYPNCLIIDGSTAAKDRQKAVDAFQNDPSQKLIVLSVKAGNTGLTLTASSNVATAELCWSPGDHNQGEDRCHRIGAKSTVNAYYIIAKDTIEERIYSLLAEKQKVFDAIARGDVMKRAKTGGIKKDLINGLKKDLDSELKAVKG
jgi:SWI/SNF-related matrix-associated actin-dependent regulator 1 of chromatin subfamily A